MAAWLSAVLMAALGLAGVAAALYQNLVAAKLPSCDMTLADRIAVFMDGRIVQVGTPSEIYEYPSSRFVAEFIGSPSMNLLKGEVTSNGVLLGEGTATLGFATVATAGRVLIDQGGAASWWSDGLVENIIASLSCLPELIVISRASSSEKRSRMSLT